MEVSRFAGKVTIPHRFAEPFGPGPLCRCATSPHTVGSHPLHKGAILYPCRVYFGPEGVNVGRVQSAVKKMQSLLHF